MSSIKEIVKAADNIHAYSLKFKQNKVYALNNPFLIEADIDFTFPNVEIINYKQLLIFDDFNNLETSSEDNTLILKQGNIVLYTSLLDFDESELTDYIKERKILFLIDNTDVLGKLDKIVKNTKPMHIMINGKDIDCIIDNTKIEINNAINTKKNYEVDIKELYDIDTAYNRLEFYEDCVIGYTEHYKIYYFTVISE